MRLYAVRQVGTNKFLPETKVGYSFNEPIENCIPRLHSRAQDARKVITNWKKGRFEKTVSRYGYEHETHVDIIHMPHRDNIQLEVVSILIQVEDDFAAQTPIQGELPL